MYKLTVVGSVAACCIAAISRFQCPRQVFIMPSGTGIQQCVISIVMLISCSFVLFSLLYVRLKPEVRPAWGPKFYAECHNSRSFFTRGYQSYSDCFYLTSTTPHLHRLGNLILRVSPVPISSLSTPFHKVILFFHLSVPHTHLFILNSNSHHHLPFTSSSSNYSTIPPPIHYPLAFPNSAFKDL